MANTAKSILVENLLTLLRHRTGSQTLDTPQAITALTKLGIPTGNAQRLMDTQVDIRIGTVQAAAEKLRVTIGDLLGGLQSGAPASAQVPPTLERALPVVLSRLAGLDDYTAGQASSRGWPQKKNTEYG